MPAPLVLPIRPEPPEPPPFPLIGALAPLGVAAALFVVLHEPTVLLLAALTPVVAVAGVLDGRRQVRRRRRRDGERHAAALDALALAAEAARTGLERSERRAAPGPAAPPGPVRRGDGVVLGLEDRRIDPLVRGTPADERERAIVQRSAVLEAVPLVVPPGSTIGAAGPPLAAAAFLRAARMAAAAVGAPDPVQVGAEPDLEIRLDGVASAVVVGGPLALRGRWFRPALATAASAAERLPGTASTPSIAELPPGPQGGLAACFAVAGGEPVVVDLVADGPHAIVAGTTGSGKSALLVAWVLALAAAHPPERVVLLLVDHKGGAAFDPVAGLPHVAGVVTDLDAAGTDRAVHALAAEVRRRERVLRDAGVADVAHTGEPRLVVVVDEFRALLEARPALAGVFTDVAARGRSLGIHLVLCTQRPAGSIRDELATNCGLRIALRVLDAADSVAVIGTGEAAALPRTPGAAMLVRAGERPRPVTVARVDDAAVAEALVRARPGGPVRRPWLEPLPARLETRGLPPVPGRVVLGLVDAPDEQAQPPIAWRPTGGLLVAGRPGSGRTSALTLVAGLIGADDPAGDPAGAWDAVHDERRPVVLDDLEPLLDAMGPATATSLLERLAQRLRAPGAEPVVLAVRGPSAWAGLPLRQVTAACSARLLLALEPDDHLALGGERSTAGRATGPGDVVWEGRLGRLALPAAPRRPSAPPAVLPWPAGDAPVVLVTSRARERVERLLAAGRHVSGPDGDGDVLVGSAAEWQAQWTRFGRLAADGPVLVDAVPPGELRALTGSAAVLPPVSGPDDVVLLRAGSPPARMRL